MCRSIRGIVGLGVLLGVIGPGVASAQILGVGPRFSLVRGDVATSTPTTRFVGGTARLKTSTFVSFEGSLDYRTPVSPARTQRVHPTPLQAFAVRANCVVAQSAMERKVGMHLVFGGECRLAKHAVVYLDYRYRFVKFSTDQTTTTTTTGAAAQQSAIAKLFGSVPGLSNLKASHQGSMWTGGVAFVF